MIFRPLYRPLQLLTNQEINTSLVALFPATIVVVGLSDKDHFPGGRNAMHAIFAISLRVCLDSVDGYLELFSEDPLLKIKNQV